MWVPANRVIQLPVSPLYVLQKKTLGPKLNFVFYRCVGANQNENIRGIDYDLFCAWRQISQDAPKKKKIAKCGWSVNHLDGR